MEKRLKLVDLKDKKKESIILNHTGLLRQAVKLKARFDKGKETMNVCGICSADEEMQLQFPFSVVVVAMSMAMKVDSNGIKCHESCLYS
ncbi:hypothetical protein M0802_008341 [Mischocyttarus mexicanus]|nr:hypothetical protein M0802_008341 [Mischocyttarus mexicanus]